MVCSVFHPHFEEILWILSNKSLFSLTEDLLKLIGSALFSGGVFTEIVDLVTFYHIFCIDVPKSRFSLQLIKVEIIINYQVNKNFFSFSLYIPIWLYILYPHPTEKTKQYYRSWRSPTLPVSFHGRYYFYRYFQGCRSKLYPMQCVFARNGTCTSNRELLPARTITTWLATMIIKTTTNIWLYLPPNDICIASTVKHLKMVWWWPVIYHFFYHLWETCRS